MPKSKVNKRKQKRSRRSNRQDGGAAITSMAQPRSSVPRPVNVQFKIRRSWNVPLSYYGTNGWFNGGAPDFQLNFAASTSNLNIGGVAFSGPAIPNASEFANFFDQYRMNGVTVRIDWNYNSYPVSGGTAVAPLIYYVADYDDSGQCLITDMLQYPGVQTHSFLENGYTPLIVSVKPKPLRDIASTGLLTAYGPMTVAPWIRTADLTTPHYGLKFCASQFGLGGTALIGTISITAYIDLEFANPK